MAIAIVVVLLIVGSTVFHFMSPWWFTPLASNWGSIDDTIMITFWVTGVVLIAINLFMAYAIWRYRYQKDRRAEYEPENKKLEGWLIGLTTLGVAAMLAPGLIVWADFVAVPEDAHVFEVMGQQWQWSYRYPGRDGILGTTDNKYVDFDNPFGIKPDDPYGQDDILVQSDEVHVPIDQPVKVLLRSLDVLHDFYVPNFRAKMDLVPGLITYFWFTPTKIGSYEVLCAELCGQGHYAMRGIVVVDEQIEFEAWLAEQPTFAQSMALARAPGTDGQEQTASAQSVASISADYKISDEQLNLLNAYLDSSLE